MLGEKDVMGLNVLTLRDIFENIKRDQDNEYNIMITYVEIYNETIRDLLVPSASYLELRDDPIKVKCSGRGSVNDLASPTQQLLDLFSQYSSPIFCGCCCIRGQT